jgi:hypothetical protein
MDHKLAIVIVPASSRDSVRASEELLAQFQKVPPDATANHFEQKFRFKRVGGWFDGLVNGNVGVERWSTVLRMLLDGSATSAKYPLSGFGPETIADIEGRIAADNTLDLDDIWPLAPCTIIVTPKGEWFADPNPDRLDEPGSHKGVDPDEDAAAWARLKRDLFWEYRGSTIVAWDLSWNFIGLPVEDKRSRKAAANRHWGFSRSHAPTNAEAWATRIAIARRLSLARQADIRNVITDREALGRWEGEGGATNRQQSVTHALPGLAV